MGRCKKTFVLTCVYFGMVTGTELFECTNLTPSDFWAPGGGGVWRKNEV
jgi:hypothetical protein